MPMVRSNTVAFLCSTHGPGNSSLTKTHDHVPAWARPGGLNYLAPVVVDEGILGVSSFDDFTQDLSARQWHRVTHDQSKRAWPRVRQSQTWTLAAGSLLNRETAV